MAAHQEGESLSGKGTAKRVFRSPFLRCVTILPEKVQRGIFPFDRFADLLRDGFELRFERPVTFFVGENGTGKSTVLNAVAELCGFNPGGGGAAHRLQRTSGRADSALADALRPSWLPKVADGYFLRADTFAEIADYLDREGNPAVHDGRALGHRSRGESLIAVFADRFRTEKRAMFLMDEPENALSPMRQLALLRLMKQWEESGNAQIVVATHSPVLMSYPGATIFQFNGAGIAQVRYEETEHYRVTKAFLADPERFWKDLMG